jgi:hypothetical protein
MAPSLTEIDAHEQPSEAMRAVWKGVSRTEAEHIAENLVVDDPREQVAQFRISGTIPRDRIAKAYKELSSELGSLEIQDAFIYHHPILPGGCIISCFCPSLYSGASSSQGNGLVFSNAFALYKLNISSPT